MTVTNIDLNAMTSFLERFVSRGRTMLLPALLEAQAHYGYIPESAAAAIGHALNVPLSEVHGVIEFYTMLYRRPTAHTVVRCCSGPACSMAGGQEVLHAACTYLGVSEGESTPDGSFMVEAVPCLGMCEHAPAALVGTRPVAHVTVECLSALLRGEGEIPRGIIGCGTQRWLTARCGVVESTSLEDYLAHDGFVGLRGALSMTPQQVIAEVKAAGLVGRGGAAFPAGVKWEGAAQAHDQPKYVICNGDESEPGTFKDRVLMEEDPFSILEGMLIVGYAVGASQGFLYIRGEYPGAQEILAGAIRTAEENGYLGENILNSGFSFSVELRSGAGVYICGEETALFESIEGKRGLPRMKPPFPTTHGLFGKPTVINNVETLCNVPLILRLGVSGYRALGTEASPGPKLFCLSGDVQRPGLYEFPFGVTLRELILEHGGGMRNGSDLQAVLLGGAAGAFATPGQLDVRLTFEDLRAAGLSLGSGAVIVFDQTRDLRESLLELASFFAHESCGKCYPCQLGTQRQYEILRRVARGAALLGDVERLQDVGWTMRDASLCGLGQTAATAVLSALQHWPDLFSSS